MTSPSLHWQCLPFEELSLNTLYAILRLRQEVFAVEQASVYLDVDGFDPGACHLFATQDETPVAYCRLLSPGVKYPEASIGRVVTAPGVRGSGAGRELMRRALTECEARFPDSGLRISAQAYLQRFYESFGFAVITAPYDEDGIPHIGMRRPAGDRP